jgi:hypothetical protein
MDRTAAYAGPKPSSSMTSMTIRSKGPNVPLGVDRLGRRPRGVTMKGQVPAMIAPRQHGGRHLADHLAEQVQRGDGRPVLVGGEAGQRSRSRAPRCS